MPTVYTFNHSNNEILQEMLKVFGSGSGNVREQWSQQAEYLVEPVGWDALWKLSKEFCKKFEVRFPCVALATVVSVDFEALTACVDVLSVQHESVSLPETVEDVPLIELWPTVNQREQCINAATTAEFIDLMRFFYNNLWMPWDDQDDKVLLSNTIEDRMQLWIELQNGTIPNCVGRTITLLRNSAISAHEKLRELDSSLCEDNLVDEDDSMLPPAYIAQCAEETARLDALAARWTLYERPLVRQQYLAKMRKEYEKNRSRRNVVALWQGGSISEFEEISQHLRTIVTDQQTLTVTANAEDALALEPEMLVLCSPVCELPEAALAQIKICSVKGATLRSPSGRSCVVSAGGRCELRGLRLRSAATAVAAKGDLRVVGCVLADDESEEQGNFAQGIVAMAGANVVVEDTTFENFYTGIVVHKGAQVELRNCVIRNCGVGVQAYSGARLRLAGTRLGGCGEASVRVEADQGEGDTMEGLEILPNCTIGTGNMQKEVVIVRHDINM